MQLCSILKSAIFLTKIIVKNGRKVTTLHDMLTTIFKLGSIVRKLQNHFTTSNAYAYSNSDIQPYHL